MKKILSAFAAAVVALSMVGCSGGTEQVSDTAVETVQSEALTFDDINIIEINGKTVSLPFKVEELGEEYSLGEEKGFNETYPALYFNNECVALVNLDNEENIISISFASEDLEHNTIKIYNLSSNDNFEKIINTIGKPNIQSELALIYEYNKGELYFNSENGSLGFNFVKISLNENSDNE